MKKSILLLAFAGFSAGVFAQAIPSKTSKPAVKTDTVKKVNTVKKVGKTQTKKVS
ncbi:hypothetical protein GS399_17380 [Pedobacter sp. HMF7647]|uniref:Acid-shock protein n=1 Tax=Hufsiella arboris TaxID=2695275 RepID=A0A7K1YFA5_9SPHI|nr:hypothetical protein [Hufsiella arboris]MXV52748.1 hypothetical protein [Hufsiella arboris]